MCSASLPFLNVLDSSVYAQSDVMPVAVSRFSYPNRLDERSSPLADKIEQVFYAKFSGVIVYNAVGEVAQHSEYRSSSALHDLNRLEKRRHDVQLRRTE